MGSGPTAAGTAAPALLFFLLGVVVTRATCTVRTLSAAHHMPATPPAVCQLLYSLPAGLTAYAQQEHCLRNLVT